VQNKVLENFDKLYYNFTDAEKKKFMTLFLDRIDIYEEKDKENGLIKQAVLRFAIFINDTEVDAIRLSKEKSVEMVCLLQKQILPEK
jgi:site-specific DNA recombinase